MIMDERAKRAAMAKGHIDRDGVGRRVQARLCPRCGRSILTGSDAPVAGSTVRVDPVPLDPWGELAAGMADLRTFDLRWVGRYELDYRDHWHIEQWPAGCGYADVVAEHRCGRINVSAITSAFTPRKDLTSGPLIDPDF